MFILQRRRKSSVNDLSSHIKKLVRKEEEVKPSASRKKEIKLRAENPKFRREKQYRKSMKLKAVSLKRSN